MFYTFQSIDADKMLQTHEGSNLHIQCVFMRHMDISNTLVYDRAVLCCGSVECMLHGRLEGYPD